MPATHDHGQGSPTIATKRSPSDSGSGSAGQRLRVPVSLRGADGGRHFLTDRDIEITETGAVQPIEYQGHHYLFAHTIHATGYQADRQEEIYVFHEHNASG